MLIWLKKKNIIKIKKYKKFITIYKMGKETMKFDDTKVEKHKFHLYIKPNLDKWYRCK